METPALSKADAERTGSCAPSLDKLAKSRISLPRVTGWPEVRTVIHTDIVDGPGLPGAGQATKIGGSQMLQEQYGWLQEQGLESLPEFLTALGIGLLIGLERERNPTAKAGLRTFALVALFGAASAALAVRFEFPALVAAGAVAVALMMIAAYFRDARTSDDPGTTTIIAVMLCYALAAMTITGSSRLAVMLAIGTTILLYFKAELRGVAQRLERRDLISMLQFAVVTFIVLPLLPDRDLGPYAALNPRQIWMMVVLISGVSLAGYVALRLVGREYGATLLGLFGGLVSSTATTLAYSRYGRTNNQLWNLSVTVIVIANLVVLLRLILLAAVVSPRLLATMAMVLGCGLLPGLVAVVVWMRARIGEPALTIPEVRNPTEIRTALTFGTLYAVVLLLAAWLNDTAGSKGVYTVAVISGLTDVDAVTLSSLRLHEIGSLSATQAVTSITIAVLANMSFKLGLILVVGGRDLFIRCMPMMLLVAAGLGAGLLLFS